MNGKQVFTVCALTIVLTEAVHVLYTLPVAYMLPSSSVCLCGVLVAVECYSECVCCCVHRGL